MLDVGSGQWQHGDVNVDVYKPIKKPNSEFVVASSAHLPFIDEAFEQVCCSHMLEHLEDPYPTFKELFRVSNFSVRCTVPHGKHPYSHLSDDHKTFFTRAWFKKALSKLNCNYVMHLQLDMERSIFYLPIEICVQAWKHKASTPS